MIEYPKTFKVSGRAPSKKEMQWLNNWIINQNFKDNLNILEFGCGISTYIIANSVPSYEKYVCVENFKPCLKTVNAHVKNITFIRDTWHNIPKLPYDIVFIDASSCTPPEIIAEVKKTSPKCSVYRSEIIPYVWDFVSLDCFFIIHDWKHRPAWVKPRKLFEKMNHKLIDCIRTKHGIGIYQKGRIN